MSKLYTFKKICVFGLKNTSCRWKQQNISESLAKTRKCPCWENRHAASGILPVQKKVTSRLTEYQIDFFAVEADEEMTEKETTRGLNDEEKNQKPSEIMGAVDKTVSAIANLMTGETDV